MKKKWLSQIQNRLPDDIIVEDETKECTQDEYIAILSWLKYFNLHYAKYGKEAEIDIPIVFVSKRIFLDFTFYNKKCDKTGKYIIYICDSKMNMTNIIKSFNL